MTNRKELRDSILISGIILSSYMLAADASVNPVSSTTGPDGNALFISKCATCHGKDGRGIPNWRSKGQPDFTDANWQKSRTDAQIAQATKNGKGKFMQPYKGSDEEITALVARIRAFGKKK